MSSVAFAFVIDGQQISPKEIDDPDQSAFVEEVMATVTERVGDLRCTEHGDTPHFVCSGPNFDVLTLEVMGCCDGLITQATDKLNQA